MRVLFSGFTFFDRIGTKLTIENGGAGRLVEAAPVEHTRAEINAHIEICSLDREAGWVYPINSPARVFSYHLTSAVCSVDSW